MTASRWLASAAGIALLGGATLPERWFVDITRASGVTHRHTNRAFDHEYAQIMAGYTALGASVAAADFDGDGYDDLFMTDSSAGGRNRLYRNNRNLTFTEIGEAAGVSRGNDATNASADSLWFDYNGDGRPDLFVARFGQSQLFENLGGARFRDVTRKAGLVRYANSITAIAFDFDRDGDLDLFVGDYFQPVNLFKPDTPRFFPESFETANNGGGVAVFVNQGNGAFTNGTAKVGIKLSGWTLDLGHADADNDGDDDLYVAADFGTDRFFRNNNDGTFTDITEAALGGLDTKKGMNVDWADFDNDGLLDVYVTNITDDYMREGNFLWRNKGNLAFDDVSRETGSHDTGWGWGAKFFDFDNDGWLDIYVMNGWVSAGKESYVPDVFAMVTRPGIDFADARNWPPMGQKSLSGYQRKRLFHNQRGELFKDVSARHGLDSDKDGRGIAIVDLDNDGLLDVVSANANAEPFVYRNTAPSANRWVQFALTGTGRNKAAIGAQVRLRAGGKTWLGYVSGGNSFAGQSSARVHFGLGAIDKLESAEVRWPDGQRENFTGLAVGKLHRISQGGGFKAP